jgi:serine/threonine protein kinase
VLLIMEYVEGETLAARIGDGPLEPGEALAILRALADAVDYLHEEGVIHRDIKPANVLCDTGGRVKLTDLGIASAAHATGITSTGTMLGTPAYMAPELFDGTRATQAADVYAVAAIAFEMLSGRRARGEGPAAAIAIRAATEPPPDLRDAVPAPAPLAEALARGMARDPAERQPSATALVDEVEAAMRTESDDPVTRRRRSPAVLIGAAAALAVAAIAAVLVAGGGGGDPEHGGSASTPRTTTTGGTTDSTERRTTSTEAGAATTRPPAVPAPDSPEHAVQAFYGRAAAHDYAQAWALATPALRTQLGGYAAFRRQFASVRSIVFSRAAVVRRSPVAATVSLATTARHTDRTDRCSGTADTLPAADGRWVLTHLTVNC